MGKIFYIMGKSSSGKDTIYRRLLSDKELGLKEIVLYTTRPMRAGEREGREYFFATQEELESIKGEGRIIELRSYGTCHGIWHYFTVDDGQVDLAKGNYLGLGTIESYLRMREYYGNDAIIPLLIELDDGERLQRALDREKAQEQPRYEEMCRRFLADAEDFSEEKIRRAGIENRFENRDLEKCIRKIRDLMAAEGSDISVRRQSSDKYFVGL